MFNFLSDLIIFNARIPLSIILYIFIGAAGLSLIVYLINLLFRKNTYKQSKKNESFDKLKEQEQQKINIDNEVASIVKNRKIKGEE